MVPQRYLFSGVGTSAGTFMCRSNVGREPLAIAGMSA